jgi:ferritin-like metal-binding protein YciE
MSSNTTDPSLADGFRRHQETTERQVERLEKAFDDLGTKPSREDCDGAKGLIKEYEKFVDEQSYGAGVLDAFAAAAALKVEHYEIAAYRSLIDLAEFCNFNKAAKLLKQNLVEEEEAAAEMQSASSALGAQLADASTVAVAGRAVGSAIDHVRETTLANLGGARAVSKRAVKSAKKALDTGEKRGRTVRARVKTASTTKKSVRPKSKATAKKTTSTRKKPAAKSRSRSR